MTQAQLNEFELNRLGYYVTVQEQWRNKQASFMFSVVKREYGKPDVLLQKETKMFTKENAIEQRNKVIEYYLNKVKND